MSADGSASTKSESARYSARHGTDVDAPCARSGTMEPDEPTGRTAYKSCSEKCGSGANQAHPTSISPFRARAFELAGPPLLPRRLCSLEPSGNCMMLRCGDEFEHLRLCCWCAGLHSSNASSAISFNSSRGACATKSRPLGKVIMRVSQSSPDLSDL
jgi:hypothetical protein